MKLAVASPFASAEAGAGIIGHSLNLDPLRARLGMETSSNPTRLGFGNTISTPRKGLMQVPTQAESALMQGWLRRRAIRRPGPDFESTPP